MAIIAISAGHNHRTGASAIDGTDEHAWNTELVAMVVKLLDCQGHTVHVLHRKKHLGYTAAMKDLGAQMKSVGADLSLELHFNAASPNATGYEYLHWLGSRKGAKLAKCLGQAQKIFTPEINARGGNKGARSLWFHHWNKAKAYSRRGAQYVYYTPCPAVICEPGFASNKDDWFILKNYQKDIARSYATGIKLYLAEL